MKTFKGVIFHSDENGHLAFAGGIDRPSFPAADREEAYRRLLSLHDDEVLDTAFEIQVLEVHPEYSDRDSRYFGERHTLNLRSALLKSAIIEDARKLPALEEIALAKANEVAATYGLDLRLPARTAEPAIPEL